MFTTPVATIATFVAAILIVGVLWAAVSCRSFGFFTYCSSPSVVVTK